MYQIQDTACVCTTSDVRIAFIFSKDENKKRKSKKRKRRGRMEKEEKKVIEYVACKS